MQSIGGLMVLLGAGSFVLHFLEREFTLLAWVDNWGVGVGNAIRVGLIVIGAIIWFVGRPGDAKSESPPAT